MTTRNPDAYLDDPCPCGAELAFTGEPATYAQCGCTLLSEIRPDDRRRVKTPEQLRQDAETHYLGARAMVDAL